MRILHVIANVAPRVGGPSRAVLGMCSALAALGHEVEVVTTSLAHRGSWTRLPGPEDVLNVPTDCRVAQDGYHITFCRPNWPTRWGTSLHMAAVLRNRIPDAAIVHIHSLYLFHTLVASRLAQRTAVPYILRPHGTLAPYVRRRHRMLKGFYHALAEDSTLRRAAGVHFTTKRELQLASPALPDSVRSFVVPLGVNASEFDLLPDRDSVRKDLAFTHDATVGLFLGRLNSNKGLDLLAPAFVQLSQRVSEASLIVAGPDDDGLGRRFIDECARGGVADRVRLTGFLDRSQIKRMLAAADFWILPSYSESFGIAVVEAMAARLPVLITDRVNISEEVAAAGAGIVVRPDVESVLDGMLRLVRMPPRERAAMGERGRALCRARFSWESCARDLSALYEEVTGAR